MSNEVSILIFSPTTIRCVVTAHSYPGIIARHGEEFNGPIVSWVDGLTTESLLRRAFDLFCPTLWAFDRIFLHGLEFPTLSSSHHMEYLVTHFPPVLSKLNSVFLYPKCCCSQCVSLHSLRFTAVQAALSPDRFNLRQKC